MLGDFVDHSTISQYANIFKQNNIVKIMKIFYPFDIYFKLLMKAYIVRVFFSIVKGVTINCFCIWL